MQAEKGSCLNVCALIFSLTTVLLVGNICSITAQPVNRRDSPDFSDRAKRPFCNAFTGCGMKRSDSNYETPSESQLDDLAKFLLAERTWEQLQKEANMLRSSGLRSRLPYHHLPPSLAYRRRRTDNDYLRSQTQPNFGDFDFKSKRSEDDYKEIDEETE